MRALAFCAIAIACASEQPAIGQEHLDDDAVSLLQWQVRRLSDKSFSLANTKLADSAAFVGQSAGEGGNCDLIVIPKGASHEDALLRVTAYIEKMGDREEDLWIRRIKLTGQWLPQHYAFKTGSGQFGDDSLYLVRMGTGEWQHPVDILKATDGLMSVAIHNKSVPTHNFESSSAQDVELVIGPVIVGVRYATSNKDSRNFNHLDLHLQGLKDVVQELGGVLASDSPEPEPQEENLALLHDTNNQSVHNLDDHDEVQLDEVQPDEVQLGEVQPDDVRPAAAVQPNEGQPDEIQLEGPPNLPHDELQLVQSSPERSHNTVYKSPASSMKFDWCCEAGKCDACNWQ